MRILRSQSRARMRDFGTNLWRKRTEGRLGSELNWHSRCTPSLSPSLVAQSRRRVEIRRAPRRQPASHRGDQEEDYRHRGESRGGGRFYAHQHGNHSTCEGEGDDQTGGDTDGREAQSLPHDQFEDLARTGTESHANADFGSALSHNSRKHAVKSYAGEQRGNDREHSDQQQ